MLTKANTGRLSKTENVDDQGAAYGSENRPLPELTGDMKHHLDIARADALVKLHAELNTCWAQCFPVDAGERLRTLDPTRFFQPFFEYGVALYEAHADALLALQPKPLEYGDWLQFSLKTSICDGLAPYRPVEDSRKPVRDVRQSEWQLHMGTTWRLFDHPRHAALFSKATTLINALEDVHEPYWERFFSALNKAMSRRTLPLLAKALKRLNGSKTAKPGPALGNADRVDRRALLDAYIEEVFRKVGKRITRTDLWKLAKYKSRTEFERWETYWYERHGRKPNRAANERFTQILTEKPHLK
jgi:hypothetical protein